MSDIRRTMCSECGAGLITEIYGDQLREAQDHVLDEHRNHPNPLSIVFCSIYGTHATSSE